MSSELARDCLVVVVDGEEVPGISVYGLARPSERRAVPRDRWMAWPAYRRSPAEVAPQEFVLRGDGWEVPVWDLPVDIWPTAGELVVAVRGVLEAVIDAGCRVAWVGAEGVPFCDPPRLFDPACMSGGVLGWMTDDGEFECGLEPDGPLVPVSDVRLLALRAYARALADAGDGGQ